MCAPRAHIDIQTYSTAYSYTHTRAARGNHGHSRQLLNASVEHERQSDLRRLVASSKLSALERLADDAERTPPRLGGTLALKLRRVGHLLRVRVRVRVLGLGLGLGSGSGC